MSLPFEPADEHYEERVRESFARQAIMGTIGARLVRVAPGEADIELPFRADLAQQHGFVHAGIVAAIADSACGYAAYSLMPAGAAVLSVEFKVNLLAPARGERLLARARVLRAGRNITACLAEVHARHAGAETLVAAMLGTMMTVHERPGLRG